MNYIDQINVFWTLDAEHSFNGNESRLYFYLLKLSNSLYWKNPLTNADGYTASVVGISVNTLKTCRNRLQQAGLIRFKTGGNGRRDKCVYEIMEAQKVIGKVSKNDTLPEERCQNLTPYPQPYLEPFPEPFREKADDINKHKPDQTKQNNSFTGISPGKGVKKKKKESSPYWEPVKNAWIAFYKARFTLEPTFDGSAAKALKKIIGALEKVAIQKNSEWTEARALKYFSNFLTKAYRDTWLQNNFLLPTLASKFDAIVNPNSNGTSTKLGQRHKPAIQPAAVNPGENWGR